MIYSALTLAAAVLVHQSATMPELFIEVGEFDLRPDTPEQKITIRVSNRGDSPISVAGLSFNAQIADSGPPPGLGVIPGPLITKVDILSGSIFEWNNTGQQDAGSISQFVNWTVTTASGTITLDPHSSSPLATLTIDTTGFSLPDTWTLSLGDTINGPTTYFDPDGDELFPTFIEGVISVPEPGGLIFIPVFLLFRWIWSRRFSKRS